MPVLRLTLIGLTLIGRLVSDGVNRAPIPGSAASLPNLTGAVLTGLAVTSRNTGQLSTAVFNTVSVSP